MALVFLPSVPREIYKEPILISGTDSKFFINVTYIIDEGTSNIYEVRSEYAVVPFQKALYFGDNLAVGLGEHFYLFDIKRNILAKKIKVDFYFADLKIYKGLIFVTDACGIYSLGSDGDIKWHQKDLGIDGVVINQFTDSFILGEGEHDPPGGWIPFKLDFNSGSKINL